MRRLPASASPLSPLSIHLQFRRLFSSDYSPSSFSSPSYSFCSSYTLCMCLSASVYLSPSAIHCLTLSHSVYLSLLPSAYLPALCVSPYICFYVCLSLYISVIVSISVSMSLPPLSICLSLSPYLYVSLSLSVSVCLRPYLSLCIFLCLFLFVLATSNPFVSSVPLASTPLHFLLTTYPPSVAFSVPSHRNPPSSASPPMLPFSHSHSHSPNSHPQPHHPSTRSHFHLLLLCLCVLLIVLYSCFLFAILNILFPLIPTHHTACLLSPPHRSSPPCLISCVLIIVLIPRILMPILLVDGTPTGDCHRVSDK